MTADQLKILRIAKIILINAFPIAGHFIFGWGLLEVALTYIIETCSVFFVFFIYSYFIAKKTRYPFGFALVQLFFITPFLGGFLFIYMLIIFSIFDHSMFSEKVMLSAIDARLVNYNFGAVLLYFISIEFISFTIKSKKRDKSVTIWYNVRKFLFVHSFIFSALILFTFIPPFIITQIAFLVLFKIFLDYMIDDEDFFKKAKAKVKSSHLFNRISGDLESDKKK